MPMSAETGGGWRSQGLGLKILLFASIAAAVFGVVRCSMELVPSRSRIETVGVLHPSIVIPPGVVPAPVDSIPRIAARQLARVLGEASGVDVRVVGAPDESLDAVATFSLTSSMGNVAVSLDIVDPEGRVLSHAESEGPPRHLYAVLGVAARRAAQDLWPSPPDGGGTR